MAGLIDFHTHFFSRPFFETLASASPRPGSVEERIETVAAEAGLELPSPDVSQHMVRWVQEMESYGLEHLITFASVPQEADAVAEAVQLAGGRFTGLTCVDPRAPEAAATLARRMEEDGFRGALVFPAMHGFAIDGPELAEVLPVLESHAGILIVHCGLLRVALRDRFGLPRNYDLRLANPLSLVPVADRHPNVKFVLPHFGAGFFREALFAGVQCENVYVDTSSSNDWRKTQPHPLTLVDLFERALEVFGSERILFGTDSSVFPRGWRHDVLLAQREALGACGASPEVQENILGGNARRLLQG